MDKTVLEMSDYAVSFYTSQGEVEAVRGIDLAVRESEILCVVGESGCGKTVMCQSVLHLLPRYGKIKRGQVRICGEDVTHASEKRMRALRGSLASMVFQDPLATLNPTIPIGKQIKEAILKHEKVSREEAEALLADESIYRKYGSNWLLQGEIDALSKREEVFRKEIDILERILEEDSARNYFADYRDTVEKIDTLAEKVQNENSILNNLREEANSLKDQLEADLRDRFNQTVMSEIYSKLDPHRMMKKVQYVQTIMIMLLL